MTEPSHPSPEPSADQPVDVPSEQSRFELLEQAAIEAELETGRREPTIHAAKRSLVVRLVSMTVGSFLVLAGLVMLLVPGPGLLSIVLGLGIMAPDVPFAARLLDRVKDRLPQDADGKLPAHVIVSMVTVAVLATAGSVWFAFAR